MTPDILNALLVLFILLNNTVLHPLSTEMVAKKHVSLLKFMTSMQSWASLIKRGKIKLHIKKLIAVHSGTRKKPHRVVGT